MPMIRTDKDVRSLQSLRFCYLCGQALCPKDRDRDHVPAKRAFSPEDRQRVPLILPTHACCNNEWNGQDEKLCDLFTGLSGRSVSQKYKSSLSATSFEHPTLGFKVDGIAGLNLDLLVQRWILAFHAALYREPLDRLTKFMISSPLLRLTIKDGKQSWRTPEPAHAAIAWKLYNQRQQGRIDEICAYNGKCHYICAWDTLDNGATCCLYALQVHGWQDLVDRRIGTPSNVVGLYCPPTPRPSTATRANQVELPKHHNQFVDAFS